uniref:Superoxide dismutase n=1 Tax=Ixodes pacificus TaxID=29930 RepID=Q6B878_IXOPA|nr:manganese superoxide dismutase [Ixodes pacificus]
MALRSLVGWAATSRAKHTLPDLPYDYGALEPVISGDLMRVHHQKHHATYVNNLNAAEEKLADALAKNCVRSIVSCSMAIKFNGGGHLNHSIYWTNLSPNGGGEPTGDLLEAIKKDFGSFEALKAQMSASAVGGQGSGLGLAGATTPSRKSLHVAHHGEPGLPLGHRGAGAPVTIDVWEHAY